ncbi:MAG: hypothetical protein ACKOZY_05120 [Flavobacteriales bacterium]
MKRILLFKLVILLVMNTSSHAQFNQGGEASGMSGAYLQAQNVWSAFHNQAGLAAVQDVQAGAFYESRFSMSSLSLKGIACAVPFSKGTFGATYESFGYDQFSQSKFGIAYAMSLSARFLAGVQLDLLSTRLGDIYGRATQVAVEGGFQYKLNEKVWVNGHLYNPNRAKISDYQDERLPTTIRAGASYQFGDKVQIAAEVRKQSDQSPSIRCGIRYSATKHILFCAGAGMQTNLVSFGFGWRQAAFSMQAAASYHPILGFSPQISMTYQRDGQAE